MESHLVELAGASLVQSTPGGARRRRRRLRKARLAANAAALPHIRAAVLGRQVALQRSLAESAALVRQAERWT